MESTATKTQPPGYSPPNPGYPQQNQTYAQPNQEYPSQPYLGYPQLNQGYQQPNATAIPNIQYQPQSSGVAWMTNIQVKPLPEDFLMSTIFTTLFCCWPIGIFAILKAVKCRDAKNRGDVDEAVAISKSTRKLMRWTVGVGVAIYLLMAILAVGLMVLTIFFTSRLEKERIGDGCYGECGPAA